MYQNYKTGCLSPFENYLVVTGNRQGREDTVIVTKGEDGWTSSHKFGNFKKFFERGTENVDFNGII